MALPKDGWYWGVSRILCPALLFVFLLLGPPAFADFWQPPTLEHWSANRQFVLRVDEKTATLTLMRSPGAGKPGKETMVWKTVSPMKGFYRLPVDAYVRDDGRFVVLQDQYFGAGYGIVLAFIDGHGRTLQTYILEDLFSQSEISKMSHSSSSIWWSSAGLFRFTDAGNRFGFITEEGAVGVFDLTTGKRLAVSETGTQVFRKEVRRILRKDLSGAVGSDSERGVRLAATLQDRETIPILTRLLSDPAHDQVVTNRPEEPLDDRFNMQLQAGAALVRILGAKAAPLLEARLAKANPTMAEQWIQQLAQTGGAAKSAAVRRCADSPVDSVRNAAVNAILENGGVEAARKHPQWLRDYSGAAIRCFAEHGDTQDIPALRGALADKDEKVRLWALRGLSRLKVSDLDTILRRYISTYPGEHEAHMALADLGDREQLRWCVNYLTDLADSRVNVEILGGDQFYIQQDLGNEIAEFVAQVQEIAKIVARHKPQGARSALTRMFRIWKDFYGPVTHWQTIGFGGLAALGDSTALPCVRALAAQDSPLTAVNAIEWLVICRDYSSAPLLRSLLHHRDELIRKAAREALAAMGTPETGSAPTSEASSSMSAGTVLATLPVGRFWLLLVAGGIFLAARIWLVQKYRRPRLPL